MRRARNLAKFAVLVTILASAACGKDPSYEEGYKAGQRLLTLGIGTPATCKGAFILSSASDRDAYLKGCEDGLKS